MASSMGWLWRRLCCSPGWRRSVALVWLPTSKDAEVGRAAVRSFGLLAGAALRARHRWPRRIVRVRHPRFRRVLQPHDTARNVVGPRVGNVWLGRFGFALLTAALVTAAARSGRRIYCGRRWPPPPCCHDLDPAEPRRRRGDASLPFLTDWLHVAAATVWTGGFVSCWCSSPGRWTPRLTGAPCCASVRYAASSAATTAVLILAATGLYAIRSTCPTPRRWSVPPGALPGWGLVLLPGSAGQTTLAGLWTVRPPGWGRAVRRSPSSWPRDS